MAIDLLSNFCVFAGFLTGNPLLIVAVIGASCLFTAAKLGIEHLFTPDGKYKIQTKEEFLKAAVVAFGLTLLDAGVRALWCLSTGGIGFAIAKRMGAVSPSTVATVATTPLLRVGLLAVDKTILNDLPGALFMRNIMNKIDEQQQTPSYGRV